jgi:hypothetical protein
MSSSDLGGVLVLTDPSKWSKWNWYDVQYGGAREIYNGVKVMFAPPVEETAGGYWEQALD